MPIANTRRAMTGGNFGSPKLDLGGCVFHAPLWRPDMVARGGSIVSGTGTMAVTPLTLAVGANTVTALTAGTFIITLPQAGTCASGDATITGSPVTIPAGVATTVTTGVTTGTFTVTTSNIIRSKDSIGHLCTVTDATWNYQGRTFDGVDDKIAIPDGPAFDWVDLTLWAWVKFSTTSGERMICLKDHDSNRGEFYWRAMASAGQQVPDINFPTMPSGVGLIGNTAANDNNWHMLGMTYKGIAAGTSINRLYLDGQIDKEITNQGYPIQPKTNDFWIGLYTDNTSGLLGTIGELGASIREYSPLEMQNIYLATKWRYR